MLGIVAYKTSLAAQDNVRLFTDELEKFAVEFSSNPHFIVSAEEAGERAEQRQASLEVLEHNLTQHNIFLRNYNHKFFFAASEVPLHVSSLRSIERELNVVGNKIRSESGLKFEDHSDPRQKHCTYLAINADVSLQPYGSVAVTVFDISSRITEAPAAATTRTSAGPYTRAIYTFGTPIPRNTVPAHERSRK